MMKSLSKSLSILFTMLFFMGVVGSAYTLYRFPQNLMEYTRTIDLIQLKQVKPLLDQLYLVVGGTFALGMLTIALLFIIRRAQTSKSVKSYEKSSDEKDSVDAEATSDLGEETHIHIEGIDELLENDDKQTVFNRLLSAICKQLEASQAAAYQVKKDGKHRSIELFASFAHHMPEGEKVTYRFGEGLAGQVAKEGKLFNIKSVPEGYIQIISGLGKASPTNLIIVPVKAEEEVVGVVEIASFKEFTPAQETALKACFAKSALKLVNNDNVSLAKAKS